MSRAHRWLFCTAWQSSVEVAPPGQSSLCCRKHLRPRGEASRKETSRSASSLSLSTQLWHTNTSYFLLHRSRELRADCERVEGVVPGDDDDEDREVETLLTEETELFVSFPSCSRGADEDTLDFKTFWNQPETRKTNCIFLTWLLILISMTLY